MGFFQSSEVSWQCKAERHSGDICAERVQQKADTELLSLLVPGKEEGIFPFILPPTVYNLVKNYDFFFLILFGEEEQLISLLSCSSEVYLSSAQRAECS